MLYLRVLLGRPLGLARHGGLAPSLDGVVGVLYFANPHTINISKVLRQYSESLFFGLGLQHDFFVFSLGSALKGFSFVSGAGPSSAKSRPQKTEGRMSRC